MQTTPSVLVPPPHTVRHTDLPDVQFLPLRLHFPFVPRSSVSGDLALRAALGAGQRQETVVSHCSGALFMENSSPPRHHVVFSKIWDSLLFFFFLILLLCCSPFILSQTCIQLSRSAGWEVGSGLIEVSSVYLAVRASYKAQTAATVMDTIVLKPRHEHAEQQQATGGHCE